MFLGGGKSLGSTNELLIATNVSNGNTFNYLPEVIVENKLSQGLKYVDAYEAFDKNSPEGQAQPSQTTTIQSTPFTEEITGVTKHFGAVVIPSALGDIITYNWYLRSSTGFVNGYLKAYKSINFDPNSTDNVWSTATINDVKAFSGQAPSAENVLINESASVNSDIQIPLLRDGFFQNNGETLTFQLICDNAFELEAGLLPDGQGGSFVYPYIIVDGVKWREITSAYIDPDTGKIPTEILPYAEDSRYRGLWSAYYNDPDLILSDPVVGDFFYVSQAGTFDNVDYEINDRIQYNGTSWDRIPSPNPWTYLSVNNAYSITSVNNRKYVDYTLTSNKDLTLPTLTPADAGWLCTIVNSSSFRLKVLSTTSGDRQLREGGSIQLLFNGTGFVVLGYSRSSSILSITDFQNAAINHKDTIYVDPETSVYEDDMDGSVLFPYSDLDTAISNSNEYDTIVIDGVNVVTSEIVLPHSLTLQGKNSAEIKYSVFDVSNGDVISFNGDGSQTFDIKDIDFKNAGGYGVYIRNAREVTINNCDFKNNGWNGDGLSTVLADDGTILGYDSTQADLQSFYAGANASNGGAMRIRSVNIVGVVDCEVYENLRGIRVQDCGIGGYGYVSRNQCYNNIESGIYLASDSYNATNGCENFTVYNNASKYNANNGVLVIGGINNVVSLNIVEGNWNAGVMGWHVSNTRFRDLDLTNNNRSQYNGIGNTGDAHASIAIGGNTARADRGYIASVLSCEVYNTGLGSNTSRIGLQVLQDVEDVVGNYDENLINVDDSGFHKQDYSIDVLADLDDVKLTIGDCRYIETVETNINIANGSYYEQPFSNHITNLKECDFSIDGESVILKEGVNGVRLNPYTLHDLQASLVGLKINIMLKDSEKIQFNLEVSGLSIDGVVLTGTPQEKVNELNAMLQHSGSSTGLAPVITSSLTVSITQGSTLNYELTADYGVGYEWDLSNVSGVTTVEGHIRNLIGGSSLAVGTYNIPVKAINYNGEDSETLVLTVSNPLFSNSKSINFANQDYLGANASLLSNTLGRTGNGSGASDAWSVSMWYKGSTNTQGQTIIYFGDSTTSNGGHIVLHQININGSKGLRFRYGHQYNRIQLQTTGITANTWQHILITYDGGTTGSQSTQINDYYGRFNIIIDGVVKTTTNSHNAFGYNGNIDPDNFRIGRYSSGNYMRDCRVDEIAIWSSDQSCKRF